VYIWPVSIVAAYTNWVLTACLSLHGAEADKKLLVHPESRIAVSSVIALEGIGVQSKDSAK
jgi:hypothetical protein